MFKPYDYEVDEAYNLGLEAHNTGKLIDDNPYNEFLEQLENMAWNEGYNQAVVSANKNKIIEYVANTRMLN